MNKDFIAACRGATDAIAPIKGSPADVVGVLALIFYGYATSRGADGEMRIGDLDPEVAGDIFADIYGQIRDNVKDDIRARVRDAAKGG